MGTTSNPHGPYVQGYTRATMAGTTGSKAARRSKTLKAGPSSDRGLQLAHVKAESLVIANQQVAVNTFPGLVHTARHTMGVVCSRSAYANSQEMQRSEGTSVAKAATWPNTDTEARKRGEQTGLDTLVVHAVNDGH